MTREAGCFVLLIAFIGGLIVFGPMLAFWSIGVLFGFHIPFTFKTWLAAVVLMSLLNIGGGSSK